MKCTPEVLKMLVKEYPNMTIKEFIEMKKGTIVEG